MVLGYREIGLCYFGSTVLVQALYYGVDIATRKQSWGLGPRLQSAIEIGGFDIFNWALQNFIIYLRYKLKEKENKKLKQKSETVVVAKSRKIIPATQEMFSSSDELVPKFIKTFMILLLC